MYLYESYFYPVSASIINNGLNGNVNGVLRSINRNDAPLEENVSNNLVSLRFYQKIIELYKE